MRGDGSRNGDRVREGTPQSNGTDATVFDRKEALEPSETPPNLPHRERHIERLGSLLSPTLNGDSRFVTVHGEAGTGKTETVTYVGRKFEATGRETGVEARTVRIDCGGTVERYRILARLAQRFGCDDVPESEWCAGDAYEAFIDAVDSETRRLILVLDGVERLGKVNYRQTLDDLVGVNTELENATVSLVCVSRSLRFTQQLEPRLRSPLIEKTVFFPLYDAAELRCILEQRADTAFKDGAVSDGIVEMCAELIGDESGSARGALSLLREAGERADAKDERIEEVDVREAWGRKRQLYKRGGRGRQERK